jgi:transposase
MCGPCRTFPLTVGQSGSWPNPPIPRRANFKQRGRFFPKRLYKLRARVEQSIGKLKRFKRVAMRCEKTDISYSAIISFACGLMLAITVNTA